MKKILLITVCELLFVGNILAQFREITVRSSSTPALKIVQVDFGDLNTLVYMEYMNIDEAKEICITKDIYIEYERNRYKLINGINIPVCDKKHYYARNDIYKFVLEFEKLPTVSGFDIVEPLGMLNLFGIKINVNEKSKLLDIMEFVRDTPVKEYTIMPERQMVNTRTSVKKGRRGYIGISAGASFPLGDFLDKQMSNPSAGFAETGLQINFIEFGYGRGVGIAGKFFGGANAISMSGFDEPWSYAGLMVGPLFSIFGKSSTLDFRPMIGYGVVIFPESAYSESSTSETLMLGFGIVSRVNLSEKIAILIGADYLYTKPQFNFTRQNLSQELTTLTPTIGVVYTWSK
jgi:hypothetical protein